MQDIFEENRTIVEPSGALAVAGIKRYVQREQCREKTFIAINSGANVNFDRLRHVAERADIGGQREAVVSVEIPEAKGSFLRFCEVLGRRNVTEFNYRYSDGASAQLFVGLALIEARKEKEAVFKPRGNSRRTPPAPGRGAWRGWTHIQRRPMHRAATLPGVHAKIA